MTNATSASRKAYGKDIEGYRFAHTDSKLYVPSVLLERSAREETQDLLLAPAATRAAGAGNRAFEEEPDQYRTCFERDEDRIRHSAAFRRLAYKCQVFVAPDNDHLRTRLTHAIEVAQVAVGIARPAGLNVALTSAAALGHDCGHGPGGHASEDAFDPYIEGGYDHAVWGADVTLAPLNLCEETLDAIRCHSWRLHAPATPEGEVVSWADRIAYLCHDCDDAIRAGIISADHLPKELVAAAGSRQPSQLRFFITEMLAGISETGQIAMRDSSAHLLDVFRKFMYENVYLRPAAAEQNDKVITILRSLIDYYIDAPGLLPEVAAGIEPHPTSGSTKAAYLAVRHVSGMTDRYAIDEATELLGARPLPRIA